MNITIYSTPTCPYCVKVKEYLKEKKLEYTDFNVADDQNKAKEMVAKSGQMGVPVIEIDGEIVIGFDEQRLAELIK